MTIAGLTAPAPLSASHDVEPFACGEPSLDAWLKRHARKNEASGASRTYVVCIGTVIVGYYCLAAGAIDRDQAPKPMQRNMPDPIPVMVLGRLAVDRNHQDKGIGSALLRDAVLRVLQVADIAGVKAILVHAISEEARAYYLARGFLESPIQPMTLCLVLDTARQALAGQRAP
ncbi:MAG TPA: GNAT family N-acetyltransferase [Thermomicrobiales bacterium]|jgi:GNAT superfamily N-acetyltransferase